MQFEVIMYRAFLAKKKMTEIDNCGTGNANKRVFFVDDLAEDGFLLNEYPFPINLGNGVEVSIKDLAVKKIKIVGFNGEFVFDTLSLMEHQKVGDLQKISWVNQKPTLRMG